MDRECHCWQEVTINVRYQHLRQFRAVRHGGRRGFVADHPNDAGALRFNSRGSI